MIESFYDFERSIEHKMDILEREGKTTCIIEYLDRFGNPKKDKKPGIYKYDEHEMMIRLPSFFREELVFIYKHSSDSKLSPDFLDYWAEWLDCDTEAEIAIYDAKTLLSILDECNLLNDRKLIDLVDTVFSISFRDHDKAEMTIITMDNAIKTTNVFKRTKEFGLLLRAARGKFIKAYKHYLTFLPKKKEIKELPEERRLIIESRINSCLLEMCSTHSWENAKILIKKYGATLSANHYEDFANKDYIRDFSYDDNYKVVLEFLQKVKAEKEEVYKNNLKNVVVRRPSKEELYGNQVNEDRGDLDAITSIS